MPQGTHRRKTAQRLYRQMVGLGVPFDIVVATPEDLELHRNNPGLIYQTIFAKGPKSMPPETSAPGSPADWLRHAYSDLALASTALPPQFLLEQL